MHTLDETRRRFIAHFTTIGLGSTLLPGVLWAQTQQEDKPQQHITIEQLQGALAVAGISFSEDEERALLRSVNQDLTRYDELHKLHIPNNVAPPFYFSSITPGMKVNRIAEPFRASTPVVKRPAMLEDVAFWPIVQLAQLIRTRQVTSLELTQMYLERLHKYNAKLNCVVTFLDDVALAQAKKADSEISAGHYKGFLHGIPWGCKDIINVKGYRVTWGSDAFKNQMLDEEASVVEMLRDAGAVLLAKLATGELAGGDQWWGGQTRNPWNNQEGSYGSSAGPASATAAGLVAFGIGTETGGSILHPSSRCGVTGLRPTFGRVSRYGVMTASWTQDRVGPFCRYAEDCALVMNVIARPDDRDMSVMDIPFNWNAHLDVKTIRVGYLEECFDETKNPVTRRDNQKTLDQLRALGIQLIPLKVPQWDMDSSGFGVESAVFFDEFIRNGRDKQLTNRSRGAGMRSAHLVPAVEYLQSQRVRAMMMATLAEATAAVDVYIAPADRSVTGEDPDKPGASAEGAGGGAGASQGPTLRHFNMANLACYPALALPNGFSDAGTPGSIIFYGRPFNEPQILAVGKAYQDASGFQLKHPDLDRQPLLPSVGTPS
jgi:Asp-tRNA(Asn)/Glu-tRNA(Gln) amidotransferase A subunit family amidase